MPSLGFAEDCFFSAKFRICLDLPSSFGELLGGDSMEDANPRGGLRAIISKIIAEKRKQHAKEEEKRSTVERAHQIVRLLR